MRFSVVVLIVSSGIVRLAPAQIVSGTIVGRAADSTGAVVPNASIALTNAGTGVARTTTTDSSGTFALPQLPPGTYNLAATATGFKTYDVTKIELLVDQTVRIDVRFELGAINQEIMVTAAAAQVDSETSALGQVIDSHQVLELPLNGRNFMQLANISSGVAPAYNSRSATITNQSGRSDLAVHVSGGRGDANSYLIDGVETRSTWFNSPSVLLSVDAIREFKIEKNAFSAEYGQGSGIVSLVSKSGSNDLHGTAYEFLRNDHLDAANFFDNYFARQKAPFKQNQYGVTAGRQHCEEQAVLFRQLGIATAAGKATRCTPSYPPPRSFRAISAGSLRQREIRLRAAALNRPGYRRALSRQPHSRQSYLIGYAVISSSTRPCRIRMYPARISSRPRAPTGTTCSGALAWTIRYPPRIPCLAATRTSIRPCINPERACLPGIIFRMADKILSSRKRTYSIRVCSTFSISASTIRVFSIPGRPRRRVSPTKSASKSIRCLRNMGCQESA